ncbi:hypothetical protein G6F57_019677 [Rhizopus arrhizus]|nr:hypothetical protein G6F57_019677 [Rhizopus arrhizus]
MYSHATARIHSASRASPEARPPAIQSTAEMPSHPSMRRKLSASGWFGPRCSTINAAVVAKCAGQDRGGDQAHEHHREQHDPHGDGVGIEPVGDPARVLPSQPDREPQHQRMHGAHQRQVVQQAVRQLRHGKDVHQVEEQFHISDAGFVAVPAAKQRGAGKKVHGGRVR